MKKLWLLFFLSLPANLWAQGQKAIINDVRRFIGQPDSTTGISNSHIRNWLGQFQREVAIYGVVTRDTLIVPAATDSIRDRFALPSDFLYEISLEKTLQRTTKKQSLFWISPDSANAAYLNGIDPRKLFERTDTLVINPGTKFSDLPNDVFELRRVFKRDSLKNRLVPLMRMDSDTDYGLNVLPEAVRLRLAVNSGQDTVKLPTDLGRIVNVSKRLTGGKRVALTPISPDSASLAYLRQVPQSFLFERIDTLLINPGTKFSDLPGDVYEVKDVFKRDSLKNRLVPLLRMQADSEYGPALLPEALRLRISVGAGQDTVKLPADFGRMLSISKRLTGGKRVALSPIAPDSASLAYLRQMPQSFLFERIDTVLLSTSKPENVLAGDVYSVRYVFRKDKTSQLGQLKALVPISQDSLHKIVNEDYYFFEGQPNPKIVVGKKADFSDTVFIGVLAIIPRYYSVPSYDSMHVLHLFPPPVATDSIFLSYLPIQPQFTFFGQPLPRIARFPAITVQESLFIHSLAVIPRWYLIPSYDSMHVLQLFPPTVASDTLFLDYLPIQPQFTFFGQPFPKLSRFPAVLIQESLFVQSLAIVPSYYTYDSTLFSPQGNNNGPTKKYLRIVPPLVWGGSRRDTIYLHYAASIDTLKTAPTDATDSVLIAIGAMDNTIRPAALYFCAAQYWDLRQNEAKKEWYSQRWQNIVLNYSVKKGRMRAAPANR